MPSRTNREQARQRLDAIYHCLRDKLISADQSMPLQGSIFLDWENQSDQIEQQLCTAFLEERAALEAAAQVQGGGLCPHCGSDRQRTLFVPTAENRPSPPPGLLSTLLRRNQLPRSRENE